MQGFRAAFEDAHSFHELCCTHLRQLVAGGSEAMYEVGLRLLSAVRCTLSESPTAHLQRMAPLLVAVAADGSVRLQVRPCPP